MELIGPRANIVTLDVSQSGSLLASASSDGTMRLWDL